MNSPEEIQIASIEEELERQKVEQKGKNFIRACLFNLLIYTHEPRRTAYAQELVKAIIEKFPCRIIWIQEDRTPSHNLLKVSASNLITTKGDLDIACDQITIQVTSSLMVRVPFIVLPHFVADMPIYLFWAQDPTKEHDILPHFQQYADKLIFDSECAEDLPRFSKIILGRLKEEKMAISDLNWTAIAPWRRVLGRTFDTQEKIFQLHGAKTVRIVYNSLQSDWIFHPEIQAIYMQAWIASQMKWHFSKSFLKEGSETFIYHNDANEVHIEILPRQEAAATPGTILEVEIQTQSDTLYSLSRNEPLSQVDVHASNPQECAMPFSLPLKDSLKHPSFLRDIFYGEADSHYEKTLTLISEIR